MNPLPQYQQGRDRRRRFFFDRTTFRGEKILSRKTSADIGKFNSRVISSCLPFDKKPGKSGESGRLSSRRKISAFCEKFGEVNKQPIHSKGSPRLRNPIFVKTFSENNPQKNLNESRRDSISGSRNSGNVKQKRHKNCTNEINVGSILKHLVFKFKKRYKPSTSYKFKKTESAHSMKALPNGRTVPFEEDLSRRGL